MALLLPFVNAVGETYGDKAGGLAAVYQDVHEIVQFAAHLSICMRWSRGIYVLAWAVPGEPWDPQQKELYPLAREISEMAVENREYSKYKEAYHEHEPFKGATRRQTLTRVKISVLPGIKRFNAISNDKGKFLGQEEYVVSYQHVVYYCGDLDANDDRDSVPSLQSWIEHAYDGPRWMRRLYKRAGILAQAAIVVTLLHILLFLFILA